ncbi:gas vesicle protein GvpG [Micromonospora globbae]|uniref:Gas vesicle protein G n=1 Tax=Micromonospora globbae TaxID=1894969 RepID=A0A420EZ61_9ACTN|nr:gas vesicle protein GvpG [Micromonospora globbae]RKF25970.1 gas vesicle protein G [Micromonospora globbae]WTF85852.1 gas vesicle protein GvpG [Micromonospora globbae]
MDILWALLTLPYAPVRGLTAVVKVIAREAESQRTNPINIRRELEELDAAAAAGELSPEERDRRQQQVLERLTGGVRPAAARDREDRPPARGGGRPARAPVRRARRADTERRRGGGVRDGSDPRRRRPGPAA